MQRNLIMFRSLTYAQRGMQALERGGITAALVKAPQSLSQTGCTYGLRLRSHQLQHSLELLKNRGLPYGKVYESDGDGKWTEVQL